ncbi:MAG TPA: hypothetical protein VGN21_03310 [Stellaceae bacterium]
MTGVPVMPSGSILPQPKAESGAGRPSVRVQTALPEAGSIAVTTLLSLATTSRPAAAPGGRQ